MPPKKSSTTEKAEKKAASGKYIEAVGRRKTAIARVRISTAKDKKDGEPEITVNEKDLNKYFPLKKDQATIMSPFKAISLKGYSGMVKVSGGGPNAQSEAIRLGFSRAFVKMDPSFRHQLKSLGFLKRDPRMVERKKYGKRKARRPQQWRKR